jgi:glycosyltransferase involved in cell wall biosynthesis
MTPKVSICIPTYCQTEYLKRTLDSIANQDHDDFEVVITDDTPDATVEDLVHQYDCGSKLIYSRNKVQLGSPANWNRAVSLSTGEYIKILHHDDWFAGRSSLSEYVELLDSNPSAGFAFSGALARIAGTGKTWHHYASDRQVAQLRREPSCLFYGNFVGPPSSTIVRRTSFVSFPEGLRWLVDIAQYIRVLKNTVFAATQKPLVISTTQATHQVTSAAARDKQLNLYEYFYLFDEIKALIPSGSRHRYIDHLVEMIYRYNVRTIEDIRRSGYMGEVPEEIPSSLKSSSVVRAWKLFRLRLARQFNLFGHPGQ